jgi:polar amino acid transport system substrate-binding protein
VLAALQSLIKSGQYTTILKKWGVESGAITDPKINGATG